MIMRKFCLAFMLMLCYGSVLSQTNYKWTFKAQSGIYSSPLIDNNTVFFGSNDSVFYALNKETGKQTWSYKAKGAIKSKAAIFNSLVVFNDSKGYITALNKSDGKLVWCYETNGEQQLDMWDYYLSSPVVKEGIVYIGSGDHHIYAINANTGQLVWKYKTGGIVHATPVVHSDRVLVGSFDGYFYALSKDTGDELWKFKTVGDAYFPIGEVQKAAAIHGNKVIFGSRDYNIYALDIEKGTGYWNMKERGSWIIATPFVQDDCLYFGTSDTHRFYCMHAGDSQIKWTLPLNMRVYATALAYQDRIYFACFNGKLYGVNKNTGEIEYEFQTEASKAQYEGLFKSETEFAEGVELYGNDMQEVENKILNLGAIIGTPCIDENKLYFGDANGNFYVLSL